MKSILKFVFLILPMGFYAQVGIGTTTPSTKAALEVSSRINNTGNYKGMMLPKVADEAAKNFINPTLEDEGLMIYVEETADVVIWNGVAWESMKQTEALMYASDLFISEYIHNGNSKKFIEIANFTNTPKNLSNYRLAIGNGKTTNFTYILLNNVSLDPGQVYVIGSAGNSNQTATLSFDGDDAVILQLGETDIDVLGMKSLDWPYGQNRTLRRKKGKGPSLICDLNDFYILNPALRNGLGNHQFN